MQIYEDQASGTATNSGFVGIGEFATSGFIPYSLLHLNNNGTDALPNTFMQVTNANTGFGTDQAGLQVGVLYDAAPNFYTGGPQGTGADYSIAVLRQWMDAPLIIYTNDNNGNMSERVRVAYGNGGPNANANTTKVNISYASAGAGFPVIGINMPPVAMLNLGEDAYSGYPSVGLGQRTWMDVGTFGAFNTDDFYSGLKHEGTDQNDAVMAWGDNYSNAQYRDYMRFIFTSSVDKHNDIGLAGADDGLEVARFTPQGHFGIGNYTMTVAAGGSRVEPARMLEVYDASLNNPDLNTPTPSAPQLRLTFLPTNFHGGGNTGIYSDFYCDHLGDLYFDTRDEHNPLYQRRVGIGKVGNFTAQSQLHQHWDAKDDVWHQFTNSNTQTGQPAATDGFKVGIMYNSGTTTSWAELRQQEDAPMALYTNDASTNIKERMKITYGSGWNGSAVANVTKVNISYGGTTVPIFRDIAILNLGQTVPSGGGQRDWMDVGTFGSKSTDNFYYGLKYESADHVDAVVSWGDNLNGFDGADNLRVIAAMKAGTSGQQGAFDGLEVARYAPSSYVGIGNFAAAGAGGSGIQPARRLEIYDEHLLNSNTAQPQLRLTYTPNSNPAQGNWTDFQTTSSGDLYIHPSASGVDRRVGINTSAPGNSLEIKTAGTIILNTGLGSGLRFSNMNNTVTPQTNPDPQRGVLSVDNQGDVIFVVDEDNGGSGTGDVTACTATGGTTADYVTKWTSTAKEICVSEIYDNGTGVGINSLPYNNNTKLTVRGLQASSSATIPASSVNSMFLDANHNELMQIMDNGSVIIGNGATNGGSFVDGQLGIGSGFGSPINSRFEIHGSSGGLGRCIEVDNAPGGTPLFYVYDNGRVGISTNAPLFPLDVQAVNAANVSANFLGDIIASGITTFSDSIFKKNVTDINNSASIINRLTPHQYNYDTAAFPQMKFRSGNQYGLIAQELEQVLPELVGSGLSPLITDSMGVVIHPSIAFKTINYPELIPFLIGAMKEQNQTIDSMRTGMMAMQTQINNCCNAGNRQMTPTSEGEQGNSIDVKLNNAKAIILNQNVPNPFAEQTTISYFLTEDVKKAQLFFYDSRGVILKIVDLNETGNGQLNVYAADLSSGNYTYSLIADGKLIETKKMVKQ